MAIGISRAVPLITVALAGLALPCQTGVEASMSEATAHENVAPTKAARVVRENRSNPHFIVLDVRTGEEFQDGHLPGAVMLDFKSPSFRDELGRLDREKTYLVYCRTGNRSGSAVSMMKEMKFKRVYHLLGGITKWKEEGLPTTK